MGYKSLRIFRGQRKVSCVTSYKESIIHLLFMDFLFQISSHPSSLIVFYDVTNDTFRCPNFGFVIRRFQAIFRDKNVRGVDNVQKAVILRNRRLATKKCQVPISVKKV